MTINAVNGTGMTVSKTARIPTVMRALVLVVIGAPDAVAALFNNSDRLLSLVVPTNG
jgi:hypothetical protein